MSLFPRDCDGAFLTQSSFMFMEETGLLEFSFILTEEKKNRREDGKYMYPKDNILTVRIVCTRSEL